MYKNTDEIFIMTMRTGYIPHLKTYGPIPNPIKCPISLCLSMIIAGVELYEYDPKTKLTKKMSLDNIMQDNKFEPAKEIEVAVLPENPVAQLTGSVAEVVNVVTINEDLVKENITVESEEDDDEEDEPDLVDAADTLVEDPVLVSTLSTPKPIKKKSGKNKNKTKTQI